jgi:uncharacterized protein YjbJ (UPF0337 family)
VVQPDRLRAGVRSVCKANLNRPLTPMEDSTKDKVKGNVDQASGKAKEKLGQATNDPDLQDEGTGEKIKGKAQEKVGDIKKVFEK